MLSIEIAMEQGTLSVFSSNRYQLHTDLIRISANRSLPQAGGQTVEDLLPRAAAFDEVGTAKQRKMVAHRWLRQVKLIAHTADIPLPG